MLKLQIIWQYYERDKNDFICSTKKNSGYLARSYNIFQIFLHNRKIRIQDRRSVLLSSRGNNTRSHDTWVATQSGSPSRSCFYFPFYFAFSLCGAAESINFIFVPARLSSTQASSLVSRRIYFPRRFCARTSTDKGDLISLTPLPLLLRRDQWIRDETIEPAGSFEKSHRRDLRKRICRRHEADRCSSSARFLR